MVKRLIQKVIASFRKKPASPAKTAKPAAPAHVPAPKPEHRPPDRAAAGEQKEWKPHRGSEAPQGDRPRREHPPQGDKPHRAHAPHGQHAEGDQRRDPRRERSHGPRHERAPRREETAPPRPKRDMTPWDPASYVVPVAEGKTRFGDLDLAPDLLHAIADLNFQYCTPIQAQSMPHTLGGRDIFGKAQTGTGKTAAFLITAMTRLLRNPPQQPIGHGTPRVLVLAPTRELCLQIHKDATALGKYTDLNIVAVFGGMDYDRQRHQLTDHQVDIVVATPGRLLDFKKKQDIHLSKVEILVIDEADRMLDMGFIPDVREIVFSTPPKGRRQTMFFSATLTPEVQRLAAAWTHEPAVIEIEPEQVAVDTVEQSVYIVTTQEKFALLYNILIQPTTQRVIVFANRRDEAERLKDALRRYNIECALLSGAVPQDKRVRTLEGFREGKFRVLVATDVAGRGIHVDGVSHVVNYNLPEDPEDYVHRIGRTGRAGASGQSVSFACEEDSFNIPKVEEYLGRPLKITHPDDAWLKLPPPPAGGIAPEGMPIRRAYSGPPGGGPRRRGPPRRSGGPRGGPR